MLQCIKMLRAQVAQIIGLPRFKGWAQVAKNSSGNYVCVFSLEGENASNFGRDLVERMVSFQPNSAAQLHQHLLDILHQTRENELKLQLACGLFLNNKATLATHNGRIVLNRGERIGEILSSDQSLEVIEGTFQQNDLLILSTEQAASFLNEIKQKITQGFDTDTIITSIVPGLHGQDNSSLSAQAFIQLSTQAIEKKNDISAQPSTSERAITELPTASMKKEMKAQESSSDRLNLASSKTESPSRLQRTTASNAKIFKSVLSKTKKLVVTARNRMFAWRLPTKIKKLGQNLKKKPNLGKILPFLRTLKPSGDVYLNRFSNKRRLWIIITAATLALAIVSAIVLRLKHIAQQVEIVEEQLMPITQQVDQAVEQMENNPVQARDNVNQAIAQLETLAVNYPQPFKAHQLIIDQLEKTKQIFSNISGKTEFTELPLFFDLRLVVSDFSSSRADASEKQAFFLDPGKKEIIQLDLEKKQSQVYSLSQIESVKDLTYANGNIYLLGEGIYRLKLTPTEEITTLKESGDSIQAGQVLGSFGSYLYVFNPEKRNLYRFLEKDNQLSDPIGWLTSKKGIDFGEVKTMAIDGDLWLSTKQGEIKKFSRGEEVAFSILGLSDNFTSPLVIYTKEDLKNLYVLEPNKERVVILSKEGLFLKEVKSRSLAAATTLLANEELGLVLAVSGSVIFEIKL